MNVVGKYRYYMDSAGEHGRLPIIVDIILVRPCCLSRSCVWWSLSQSEAMSAACTTADCGQR